MTTDIREGPLEAASAIAAPAAHPPVKKSWREKRWERRRRRIWIEEILGWILVPVIVLGCYYLIEALLSAPGTSLSSLIEGIRLIVSSL